MSDTFPGPTRPAMHKLMGERIAWLSLKTNGYLEFETGSGRLRYQTRGSCCAYCWFHSLTGLDAIGPSDRVIDVSESKWEEMDTGDEYGVLERQVIRITTQSFVETEVLEIEVRVSHNGYYDGWVEEVPDGEE